MELDLHGTKHEDVDRVVENFVLLNEPPFTVITGNSDMMTSIVLNTLVRLKMSYERWDWGEIKVLR